MSLRFLISCLLPLCIIQSAFAQNITGVIDAWSPGSPTPLANQEVQLKIFENGKQIAAAKKQTRQDGSYSFPMSEHKKSWYYQISTTFDDTVFETDFFIDMTKPAKTLTVAETTGSLSDIALTEVVFFEIGKSSLAKVTHQVEIENKGDKTYHPSKEGAVPLLINLLRSGFNLSIVNGITRSQFDLDEGKDIMLFKDTILPKSKTTFQFSYMYPVYGSSVEFVKDQVNLHKSLHIFFNKKAIFTTSESLKTIDIPEGMQTTFVKGYQVQTSDTSLQASFWGLLQAQGMWHLLTFVIIFILSVASIILIFSTKPRKQITTDSLKEDLQKLIQEQKEAPSQEGAQKIDLLKRRLYHILHRE